MAKPGGTRVPFSTRANYEEWGLKTVVDEENRRFVVICPFAPDELPYYPVLVAALIAGRSPGTMYHSLERGRHGLEGVRVEGVAQVTHDSLVQYLKKREESAEAILERKRASIQKMKPKRTRKRPKPPRPVSVTHDAQALLDRGEMDFLAPLKKQAAAHD